MEKNLKKMIEEKTFWGKRVQQVTRKKKVIKNLLRQKTMISKKNPQEELQLVMNLKKTNHRVENNPEQGLEVEVMERKDTTEEALLEIQEKEAVSTIAEVVEKGKEAIPIKENLWGEAGQEKGVDLDKEINLTGLAKDPQVDTEETNQDLDLEACADIKTAEEKETEDLVEVGQKAEQIDPNVIGQKDQEAG